MYTDSWSGAWPEGDEFTKVSWFHSGMVWGSLIDRKHYVGVGDMEFIGRQLAKASYNEKGDFLNGQSKLQEIVSGACLCVRTSLRAPMPRYPRHSHARALAPTSAS